MTTLLANIVLIVHALLALFIVCALPVIWAGAMLQWEWVRNRGFRFTHVFAICVVALLSVLGIACPLTVLEDWLRHGSVGSQGFIQHWVSRLLFYDLPTWVFTLAYVIFALLVMLTWRWIPPKQHR
ncbi:DUF2784 domain-containing protein [Trinickia terrae]|uniref:DUF2784 domain-containing protein n=1 Tax=Trinickia terrae TaxID=2571161 RepID=A0A4U1I731_9BURK|nr:DUF2784 domain-containing protein [Trinickia terrae]TKC89203.1 DUF2784 domain-containing protein [Trinickia terrae]